MKFLLGLFSSSSHNWETSDGETSEGKTSISSDDGGVVDDVLGGVVGHVLLDGDLGHVLDLVVDLVTNVLDNRGGVDSNSRGGVDQSRGGMDSNSRGSDSNCGSWGLSGNDSRGSSQTTVNTSEETSRVAVTSRVAKDLGLSISRSLAVVVAVVSVRVGTISIGSISQSVISKSITISSIVGIGISISISRSLAVVVAVVSVGVGTISIGSISQSVVAKSITISSIVGIGISLSLSHTANNCERENNQEFHVEC